MSETTNKPTHTAGPWSLDDISLKVITPATHPQGFSVIANVSANMDFARGRGGQFANATLIAAAPDLLKHLQYMVDAWEDVRISGRRDIMEDFTEMAKEAIKRATV